MQRLFNAPITKASSPTEDEVWLKTFLRMAASSPVSSILRTSKDRKFFKVRGFQSTGLVMSQDTPWIAACPDDRVQDPSSASLGRVQNPVLCSGHDHNGSMQPTQKLILPDSDETVKCRLKKRHNSYFQVNARCIKIVTTSHGVPLLCVLIVTSRETLNGGMNTSPSLKYFTSTHFFLNSLAQWWNL